MKRFTLGLILVCFVIALVGCGGGESDTASKAVAESEESSETSVPNGVLVVKGLYIGQDFDEAVAVAEEFLGERIAGEELEEVSDDPPNFDNNGAQSQYRRSWDVEKTDSKYVLTTIHESRYRNSINNSQKGYGGGEGDKWKEWGKWGSPLEMGKDWQMYADDSGKLKQLWIGGPSFITYLFGSGIENLDLEGFGKQFADGYDLDPFERQWDKNSLILTQLVEPDTRVEIRGATDGRNGLFWINMVKEEKASFD